MVLLYLLVIIPFIKTFLLVVESKVFHILHSAYLKCFFNIFSDFWLGFLSGVIPYSFPKTGFLHIMVSEKLM